MEKISLSEKLSKFSEFWSPKEIGELNGCSVMVVKCKGELSWHHHNWEDEMFLCLDGELIVRSEDGEISLKKGECAFVEKGVRHQTASEKGAEILYISKRGFSNTGNMKDARTVANPGRI